MRILVLSNLYPPLVLGGYELSCANIAEELKARGHDLRVLTGWCHLPEPAGRPAHVLRGLDVRWHVPLQPKDAHYIERELYFAICSCYPNTLRLLEVLREFRPEVVYVFNLVGIGGVAILDLLNMVGVPWVLHLMDTYPEDVVRNVPPAVLAVFNAVGDALYAKGGIISMSRHILDRIRIEARIDLEANALLVPGAADFSSDLAHGPYRVDGATRFVSAGTVARHKGIDLILEASARLKAEGLTFFVDVYGAGELAHFVGMARTLRVDDRVRFLGPRPQAELLRLFTRYDAFLFPTWEGEPFGLVPIEAAGHGAPPIMTWQCGASEYMVDGVHCLKIERNADSLAGAMRRVISGEVDLPRMGRAASRLARSDLNMERCMLSVETALQGRARAWDTTVLDDHSLPLLAYLKHNLATSLRFGCGRGA